MEGPFLKIEVIKGNEDLGLPSYATQRAAGLDLKASLITPLTLKPGERGIVPTGLKMEIPSGFEGCVRPRSGLALKQGITLINSPGTIDSDYRGEVKILLINLGNEPVTIQRGDRVAQLLIAPVVTVRLVQVEQVDDTSRGEGGFGHTGLK